MHKQISNPQFISIQEPLKYYQNNNNNESSYINTNTNSEQKYHSFSENTDIPSKSQANPLTAKHYLIDINNYRSRNSISNNDDPPILNTDYSQLQHDLSFYQNENSNLKNSYAILKQQHDQHIKEKSEYLLEKARLIQEIEQLNMENNALLNKNNSLEKTVTSLQLQNTKVESEIKSVSSKLNKVLKDKMRLKDNLQLFINENKEAANHIKRLEKRLSTVNSLEQEKIQLCQYNEQLIDEVEHLKNEVSNLEKELRKSKQREMDVQKEMKEEFDINEENVKNKYENYISNLNEQINQLETQIEILQGKVNEMNKKNFIDKSNEKIIKEMSVVLKEEQEKNGNAIRLIDALKKEVEYFKHENTVLMHELNEKENDYKLQQQQQSYHQQRIINNKSNVQYNNNNNNKPNHNNNNHNTSVNFSSDEDNEYLKKFINDLHEQIDGLNNELMYEKSGKNTPYTHTTMASPIQQECRPKINNHRIEKENSGMNMEDLKGSMDDNKSREIIENEIVSDDNNREIPIDEKVVFSEDELKKEEICSDYESRKGHYMLDMSSMSNQNF